MEKFNEVIEGIRRKPVSAVGILNKLLACKTPGEYHKTMARINQMEYLKQLEPDQEKTVIDAIQDADVRCNME